MVQKTVLTQADSDIILDALKKFPNPYPDYPCQRCRPYGGCLGYCDKTIAIQDKRKELEQLGLLDAYEAFAKIDLVSKQIDRFQKAIETLQNKRTELVNEAVKFQFAPPETKNKDVRTQEEIIFET